MVATAQSELIGREVATDAQQLRGLLDRAHTLYRQAHYSDSVACAQQALILAAHLGDTATHADMQNLLGLVEYHQGNYPAALIHYGIALDVFRQADDDDGIVRCLNNTGMVYERLGVYRKAFELYSEALRMCEAHGDKESVARAQTNLGCLLIDQGQYDQAQTYLRSALRICEELDEPHGTTLVLNNLGRALHHAGAHDEALDCFERSLALRRAAGSQGGMASVLTNLAECELAMGRHQDAAAHAAGAHTAAVESGGRYEAVDALLIQARVHLALGAHVQALALLDEAHPMVHDLGGTQQELAVHRTRAQVFEYCGSPHEALVELHRIATLQDTMHKEQVETINQALSRLNDATVERERAHSELRIAREIQMAMVPRLATSLGTHTAFDVDAALVPAREVGGDLFDCFMEGGRYLWVVVGDVAGKGVPAALVMMATVTLIRAAAVENSTPAVLLQWLNTQLARDNATATFVTIFIGKLDLATGEFSCSNAGHNAPVIIAPQTPPAFLPATTGTPLGLDAGATYPCYNLTLVPGSLLCMYTDGVTEAQNQAGELYTDARLLATLADNADGSCRAVVASLQDAVVSFASGRMQSDDITILAVRYTGALFPEFPC